MQWQHEASMRKLSKLLVAEAQQQQVEQKEGVMYCLEIMECSMLEGFSITTTTQCVRAHSAVAYVFDSNRRTLVYSANFALNNHSY